MLAVASVGESSQPIVQSAVLPLLDAKQDLPLGSTVALELIRDPRFAVR
jgi:hypothetical protein